jgi:hypothetical protein
MVRVPTRPTISRPHASTDHMYNSLPFSIQNSNSYSCMSQTFMLHDSHMGPTPVMPWRGSPAAGQPPTWPALSPPAGYWSPPPPTRYWPPLPLADHPGQSSNTPPAPFDQGYWPPPWMKPTLQLHWPSSPLTVLSIVPLIIRANVEWLTYSSIYVFKRPSSSTGRDFAGTILNMGGSDEGDGGGTGNDATLWSSCAMWCICVVKWWCIIVRRIYGLSLWFIYLKLELLLFCYLYVPCFEGSPSREAAKTWVI